MTERVLDKFEVLTKVNYHSKNFTDIMIKVMPMRNEIKGQQLLNCLKYFLEDFILLIHRQ